MGRLLSIWQLHESHVVFKILSGVQDADIHAPETPLPQSWVWDISGQVLFWFFRPVRSSHESSLGTECEGIRMKIIGKPYSGKPNVRNWRGGTGDRAWSYYASSLLYCKLHNTPSHKPPQQLHLGRAVQPSVPPWKTKKSGWRKIFNRRNAKNGKDHRAFDIEM